MKMVVICSQTHQRWNGGVAVASIEEKPMLSRIRQEQRCQRIIVSNADKAFWFVAIARKIKEAS